jgi:hypothetical protein
MLYVHRYDLEWVSLRIGTSWIPVREKWDYRKLCDIVGKRIYGMGGPLQYSASARHAGW